MEDTEYQVWQRVAGKPQLTPEALLRLSQEQAAALRALEAGSTGNRKCLFHRLSAQAVFAAQVLAGAAILEGETPPRTPAVPSETGRRALALAYRRSRKLWEAYRARSAAGVYSQAYQHLARQEAQSGVQLLAMLGGG